jgi:hypothetical protein
MAKAVTRKADGSLRIDPYDKETWFRYEEDQASTLRDFGRALYRHHRHPLVCVLRGEMLADTRAAMAGDPNRIALRRHRNADATTNTLRGTARAWVAIDLDDVPAPPGLGAGGAWMRDVPATVRALLAQLPPELSDVDSVAQVTGSAGFKAHHLVRLRLWFALLSAVTDAEASRWAKAWNQRLGTRFIDPSVFQPQQPHFVADPILGPGVVDPVGQRWHYVKGGQDRDRANLIIPAETKVLPAYGSVQRAADGCGFDGWVSRIGSIEWGFWQALNGAWGAAARARMAEAMVVDALSAAVLRAPPGHRDKATIGRYADKAFLAKEYRAVSRLHANQLARMQATADRLFPCA